MKKVLFVLMALLVASPAMAATFTLGTPDTSVNGQVTIPWTADAGVVGIGLKVDVTDGTATSVSVSPTLWFNVFLDSAFTIGSSYTIGQGMPTATQNAAGQLALPQASFSICVGGLDDNGIGVTTGGEEAPLGGTIVIVGTAGKTVVISEDTLRGGVVGYDGAMTLAGLPKTTAFGAAPAGPACWNAKQCKGDFSGDGTVNSTDFIQLKNAYGKSYGQVGYDACADANRDGNINSADFVALKNNYGTSPTATCAVGGAYPPAGF